MHRSFLITSSNRHALRWAQGGYGGFRSPPFAPLDPPHPLRNDQGCAPGPREWYMSVYKSNLFRKQKQAFLLRNIPILQMKKGCPYGQPPFFCYAVILKITSQQPQPQQPYPRHGRRRSSSPARSRRSWCRPCPHGTERPWSRCRRRRGPASLRRSRRGPGRSR